MSAMQVYPGQTAIVCGDCAWPTQFIWPPDPDGIEMLLMQRPDETTRNWVYPESLDDLLYENIQHGILPKGIDHDNSLRPQALMGWTDQVIDSGLVALSLRSDTRRHAIEQSMVEEGRLG